MHPVASGAVARVVSFVPTAIASLVASRLIISHFGIPAFDGFTVAESLIVLVPLGDLGVGSAITAAFASQDPTGPEAEGVVLTAARITAVAAVLLGAVSIAMAAGGLWTTVLGSASYGGWFFGLAMLFYAIGFVPGLGQAMLLGVHRNHLTILVQALIMPGVLFGVVLLIVTHGNGRWVVALPAASLAAVNLLTSVVASRVTQFSWRSLLRKLPWRRRYAGSRIRGIAGPRLVLSLTVPLALASDRLVLSHFATREAVAQYGVCLQIFAPVTALIAAAAQPLWPIYVAAKAAGSVGPRVSRTVLGFSVATLVVCAVLLPLSGPLGDVVGGGKVPLGLLLPFAAALMTVVFAAAYPVGVALTSPKELRFMAVLSVVALPLNLAFSIVLARTLGASGPLFATTGVGLAQTFAGVYYLRTHASDPPSWVGVGPDPTEESPDGLTAAPVDVQSWWSTNP